MSDLFSRRLYPKVDVKVNKDIDFVPSSPSTVSAVSAASTSTAEPKSSNLVTSVQSLESLELPCFPECKQLMVHATDRDYYYMCLPLYAAVGIKLSKIKIRNILKDALNAPCTIHERAGNRIWDGAAWRPVISNNEHVDYCIHQTDLRPFLIWILSGRTRKSVSEKCDLLKQFNIDAEALTAPIENDLLQKLNDVCPYPMILQYRLGSYRLDAFIPRINLAIEIQENGHRAYNENDEKERRQAIKDRNIVLFEFNPSVSYRIPVDQEFIRQVWAKLTSLEFSAYRTVNNLSFANTSNISSTSTTPTMD